MPAVGRAMRWWWLSLIAAVPAAVLAQAPAPAATAPAPAPSAAAARPSAARDAAPVEILCGVPSAWCVALADAFTRDTGVRARVTQKPPGEALSLLTSQRALPRYDVWFAGAGDLHIAAAQAGLTEEYRSPALPSLRDWSQRFAEQAGYRSVALYQRPIGLLVNTRRLAARQIAAPACWSDLADPRFDDQVQMANPTEGATTRATIVALVTVYGEARAFEILKKVHANVAQYARRAPNAARAVARGDITAAIVYMYDGANEVDAGFPVEVVAPCEGVAFDVVAMSIVKGARHADAARQFYDWALTPAALALEYAFRFWQMPAHRDTALKPNVVDTDAVKTIPNDYERITPEARRRIYAQWEREVGVLPR